MNNAYEEMHKSLAAEIAAEGISLGTEPGHDNWNEMLQVELEEV